MNLDLPPLLTIDLDGPVAYRLWDGPSETTFVMVHGLGGAHVNWVTVAPGLSGLGRVFALDLPGSGSSPRAGRGSGLMDSRRTLSRFIAELGGGPVVLCGNSLGGGISVLQAAVEPGSVRGLVLSCSIYPRAGHGAPHPLILAVFGGYRVPWVGERIVGARMGTMSPERTVRLGLAFTAVDPAHIPREVVLLHEELVARRRTDPDAVPAFLDAARSMLRLGRRPAIARRAFDAVVAPVLVLHGRRDRLVPAAFAEAELRRHPAWRGRIFPDLGHVPMLEAPGRWLSEVSDWHAERVR